MPASNFKCYVKLNEKPMSVLDHAIVISHFRYQSNIRIVEKILILEEKMPNSHSPIRNV